MHAGGVATMRVPCIVSKKEWIIPGVEDMLPYLTASDKLKKWIIVTVGTAALAALMAEFMTQYVG